MYRYEQTVLKKLEESQLIVRQRTSELKRINDSSMDVSKQSSPNTSKWPWFNIKLLSIEALTIIDWAGANGLAIFITIRTVFDK